MSAIDLARQNLYDIFGEPDEGKRAAAIATLWVPGEDATFVDPSGVYRGHDAINVFCSGLYVTNQDWVFHEIGEAQTVRKGAAQGEVDVARLWWGFGPKGEKPAVTGEDIITVRDGKIERCYVFISA